MKKRTLAVLVALALTTVCVNAQQHKDEGRRRSDSDLGGDPSSKFNSVHVETNNGEGHRVGIRGEVRFNDDYTDVVSVGPGGLFEVRERRGGTTRAYEVAPDGRGGLVRTYTVNGERRELDAAARQWLSAMLAESVRNGLYAEQNARRILRERGADALLEEAGSLKKNYTRSVFYSTLLDEPSISTRHAARALGQLGHTSSDYEKSRLLVKAVRFDFGDAAFATAFFDALGTIKSDYYQHLVLVSLTKERAVKPVVLLRAVSATKGIGSDYYKSQALLSILRAGGTDASVLNAVLEAAQQVGSDYYRNQVVSAINRARA